MRADFERRMERLLAPDDLTAFLESLREPPVRGLRLNPAKVDAPELRRLLGVELSDPVPWAGDEHTGFVLPSGAPSLGLHPAIDCGLFYLQDPASMLAAAVMAPQPGWRVADVAAAPGGKTTDLAARVGPGGLVLANEVVRSRLRLLESALDRWGSPSVVTCSAEIERLPGPGGWDGVLLDAPCTGEALFRRDRDAARGWSDADVRGNARRQSRLLDAAARLVRPGGVLVYSTCSFERAENEEQVERFLARHGDFELELERRIWPHRDPGNGQFVARLTRAGEEERVTPSPHPRPDRAAIEDWRAFRDEALPGFEMDDAAITAVGEALYLAPGPLDSHTLSRPGLPLGRRRPGRFEPAPALATAAEPSQAAQTVACTPEYLRGEAIPSPGPDGWVLVTYERWGLGWARRRNGILKNFLSKAQRR